MSKKMLRREDSFLGLHFDFHARETDENIGDATTREMLEEVIRKTGVDYIQTDCKGHPGYTSYPSRMGNAAPGIGTDALRLWREVTREHGVGLYLHYSGVWDTRALAEHPEWARVDENGKPDVNNTSLFGPYVDELMIPQICELIDEYEPDGIWVDGDCWAACQDYCEESLAAFRKETGIEDAPVSPDDPNFHAFMQHQRERFRWFLRRYTDAAHRHSPSFQVCSNWAFTSYMPEPVSAGVDFISGDYPLNNSVSIARFEARCMMNQGKPWDLMAWGFCGRFGKGAYSAKTAIQLMQEAAVVLSLGGGFQVYYTQNRDGSVRLHQMDIMAEVAAFCRERQALCHKARAVPQIGLLYSGSSFYKRNRRLFSPWDTIIEDMKGVLACLGDGQHCCEIIMEHHHNIEKYPMVVVPEWEHLDSALVERLAAYAQNGGNLLVIGKSIPPFAPYMGLEVEENADGKQYFLKFKGATCGIDAPHYLIRREQGTLTNFGELIAGNDFRLAGRSAFSLANYGKGKIGALHFGLGEQYSKGSVCLMRDFLSAAVDALFPERLVRVEGTHCVDVTLMEKDGRRMVHLINLNGGHANECVYVYDEIPPTGPFTVNIRTDRPVKKVTLEPGAKELAFHMSGQMVTVEVDNIPIHGVLILS